MALWTCDLVGPIAFPATTLTMQYREGHMTEAADDGRLPVSVTLTPCRSMYEPEAREAVAAFFGAGW